MIKVRYANAPIFHEVAGETRYVSCPINAQHDRQDLFVKGWENRNPLFCWVGDSRCSPISIPMKKISEWNPIDKVIFVESAEAAPAGDGYIWRWAEVFTDEEARLVKFFRSLRSGCDVFLSDGQSAQLRSECISSTKQAIAVAADDVFSLGDLFVIVSRGLTVRQPARDYLRSLGPQADPPQ